jgi:hypothetical protein
VDMGGDGLGGEGTGGASAPARRGLQWAAEKLRAVALAHAPAPYDLQKRHKLSKVALGFGLWALGFGLWALEFGVHAPWQR